jgi:hypothetical protein
MEFLVITCPYEECKGIIVVAKNEINCGIFRHLYCAETGQIQPHASKEECENWLKRTDVTVYGCGKPFKYNPDTPGLAEICDYI